MGEVFLEGLPVAGLRQGQPLCTAAHGEMAEPKKPAALSAEIRRHLLRGTPAHGASSTEVAGLSLRRQGKLAQFGIDRKKKQLYFIHDRFEGDDGGI